MFDAAVQGTGVTLSLTLLEPVEFSWDGRHFLAFAWMGEIHVWGLKGAALARFGGTALMVWLL